MFDRVYNLPEMSNILSLDIETSGLDPKKHQIIEVGLAMGDGKGYEIQIAFEADAYEWTEDAEKRHGRPQSAFVVDDFSVYSRGLADVALAQWVQESGFEMLLTYNGTKFDLEFIKEQLPLLYDALSSRMHFDLYTQIIKTKLGYSAYDGAHNLDEMCRVLIDKKRPRLHSALRDAEDTLDLLEYFREDDPIWRHLLNGSEPDTKDMAHLMRAHALDAANYERYKNIVVMGAESIREDSGGVADKVDVGGAVRCYFKTSTRKMPRIPKGYDIPDHWYQQETSTRKTFNFKWED